MIKEKGRFIEVGGAEGLPFPEELLEKGKKLPVVQQYCNVSLLHGHVPDNGIVAQYYTLFIKRVKKVLQPEVKVAGVCPVASDRNRYEIRFA
jgi:hypothetical protein